MDEKLCEQEHREMFAITQWVAITPHWTLSANNCANRLLAKT